MNTTIILATMAISAILLIVGAVTVLNFSDVNIFPVLIIGVFGLLVGMIKIIDMDNEEPK